jgi:hypothetical protein
MTKKVRLQEKAPKTCRECQRWGEVKDKIRIHELLEQTIKQFEGKIKKKDYEPTVAEYVKLLQLEREIGLEDEPKEIKVTWVGPKTTSDSEK